MKSIAYLVAGLLLISGLAAIGIGEEAVEQQEIITLTFSELEVIDRVEPYIGLNYKGAEGCLYRPNEPILPIYTKTISLPSGIKISKFNAR